MERERFRVGLLHGGKSQDQREASLAAFRTGDINVLVATDVAGRGLDIPNVSHVINYNMSKKIDAYCHRIGRTGRAGKSGVATTLLCDDDSEVFWDLNAYLVSTAAAVPRELANHAMTRHAPGSRDDQGRLYADIAAKKKRLNG